VCIAHARTNQPWSPFAFQGECVERSGGKELSSHARPAPLTHCVPPRGGTRRVRRGTAQTAGANGALRLTGSEFGVLAVAPVGSPEKQMETQVGRSSDAECTKWCASRLASMRPGDEK